MSLKKIICPQCGSNELEVFGSSAYKCESCGTILKEQEPEAKKPSVTKFRSKREFRALDDDNPLDGTFSEDHVEASNQFIKTLFWILMITGVALGAIWLLSE